MARKVLNGLDLANQVIVNVATPSSASDAATKGYVDNVAAGLAPKDSVRVATTANGALATAFAAGQSVDGVALVTGDRVLIKNQTTGAENGIYTVNASGAPTRATDFDSSAEIRGALVIVEEGTTNADSMWLCTTNAPITVGTTALAFSAFTPGVVYTADGNGIEVSAQTFSLELDGTTLQKSSAGLRLGSGAAGAGLTESSGVLAVGAGTGISVSADAVAIDTSVVARKASATIGNGSSTALAVTHNLGTKDVIVQVRQVSDDVFVDCDVVATDTNTVTLTFAVAPTASQYRVTVTG